MSKAYPRRTMKAERAADTFAWGAAEIGRIIGRNQKQTWHLLTQGAIKSAKKVGGTWVASRGALLREFGADG